jgi:hypothetical protein
MTKIYERVTRTILEHRLIILGLYLPNVRDRWTGKENLDEPWKRYSNTQKAQMPGSTHRLFEHSRAPGGYQMEPCGRLLYDTYAWVREHMTMYKKSHTLHYAKGDSKALNWRIHGWQC